MNTGSNLKVGTECEGIYSGLQTLFVCDKDVSSLDIAAVITQHNIQHIYFGADQSEPNYSLADEWSDKFACTVEIPMDKLPTFPPLLAYRLRLILTIKVPDNFDFIQSMTQVKLETNHKCYITMKMLMMTNEKNYLDTPL